MTWMDDYWVENDFVNHTSDVVCRRCPQNSTNRIVVHLVSDSDGLLSNLLKKTAVHDTTLHSTAPLARVSIPRCMCGHSFSGHDEIGGRPCHFANCNCTTYRAKKLREETAS